MELSSADIYQGWSYYVLDALLMPAIAQIYDISLKLLGPGALASILATTVLAVAVHPTMSASLATSFPRGLGRAGRILQCDHRDSRTALSQRA